MAHIPITAIMMMNSVNSTSNTQSSSSLVESAARHQNILFGIYVAVLFVGAVAAAVFTVLVYKAGNRYQSAIKADADARIESAKKDAKLESQRIEETGRQLIAQMEADSRERIAKVQSDADIKISATKERTAQLEKDAAALREQNLQTERALEQERQKTATLERINAPRIIVGTKELGDNASLDGIKAFAGTQVIIECIGEGEPQEAASYVEDAVKTAGWLVIPPIPRSTPKIAPGVFIQSYSAPSPDLPETNSRLAADALMALLGGKNGWVVESNLVRTVPVVDPILQTLSEC